MNDIRQASDLRGKKVLVRIDADVPVEGDAVVNPFRLAALVPTIEFLIAAGARVMLLGHLGRDGASLAPVYDVLRGHLPLSFTPDIVGAAAREAVGKIRDGDVLLLDNIRREAGEEANEDQLAKQLAAYADCYVNEAFAACHRKHASIVGIPKYLPSFAGIQLQAEVAALSGARTPSHPSLFILGGAKFETKLPLIEAFIDLYDTVFVGGALANDFFKARGYFVGDSLVAEENKDLGTLARHERLLLPVDVVVGGSTPSVKKPGDISAGEKISDAGPETIALLSEKISDAACVLWNGPLGEYTRGFAEGTNALARAIADAKTHSILGGGDTSAAVADLHLEEKYTFLSTGGGAMLEFLLHGTLPGIEALG